MSLWQSLRFRLLVSLFRGTTGRNRPRPFSGLSRTSPTHSAPTFPPQKDGTTRETSPHPPGVTRSFGAISSFTPAYGTAMSSSPGSTKSSPSPNKSLRPSPKPPSPRPHTRPIPKHPTRHTRRHRSARCDRNTGHDRPHPAKPRSLQPE